MAFDEASNATKKFNIADADVLEEQDCECSTLNIKNGLRAMEPEEETEDEPSIVTPTTLGTEEIGFSLMALKPSIISSYLLKI